ncbi:tape measure protein [Salmonella enterica]|nr:hypothetical protein [Salmonella enterica]EJT1137264.1 tape measure protein [Salmonella enterica]EJY5886662.1 tape measure protein [Salmonella enterica]
MTQNVGDIEYVIKADTAQLLRADKQVVNVTNSMESGFKKADKSADALNTGLTKLASTLKLVIAAGTLREMARMVQSYQEMSERVQMATSSQEEFQSVQKRLLNTANDTYRSLSEAQELYITTADSLRSMGYSTQQALDVQDSMSFAFVKNATSADRANNAISAFSKSINKGKVEADSWETIIAAIPSVIGDIATASGKTTAEIRALGSAGKLTASQLTEGLKASLDSNASAAKGMSNNLTDAGVRIKTAITEILVSFEGQTSVLQTFTNGLISAADVILEFGRDSESMAGLIDTATIAAKAFALVMAGRYAGALNTAIASKVQSVSATRQMVTAESQAAQAALIAANATRRKAVADKEAALSAVALAQAEYNVAKGSTAEMLAMDALVAAKSRASTASLALAEAENTQAAASTRAAAAARAASVGVSAAGKALSLVGGPAGFAMLAATAVYYLYQKVQQAKQESIDFADSLDGLTAKMKEMSSVQIASAIAKTEQSIIDQQDAIASLRAEYEQLEQKKTFIEQAAQIRGTAAVADDLAEANRNLAVQADKVEQAENKLSRTTSSLGLLRAQANGQFREGIDLLRRDGEEAGVAAGMMGKLGDMINFAAKAKEKYNSSSLMVMRSEDGDKILSSLEKQNSLLSITDKKERAVAEARQAALDAGVDAHSNQMRQIEEAAAKRYDLQKADSAATKSTKEGSKAVDEAAKSLTRQQAALDRLNTGYAEGSLELAQYDAVVALGNKATTEQIAKAKQQAKAIWQVTTAIKNRAQAEQAKRFTDQEIATNKTTPDAVTGAVQDPVAQINLQEQQKLAALAQYQQMGVLSVQQYEDAKTAIQEQASNARKKIAQEEADSQIASTISILNAASSGFDSLAGIISNTAGKANSAYVAMFAAAKSFAIAAATLDFNGALLKALNAPDSLTTAQRFANYAAVASAGASVLSNIASVSMSGGRRYGGTVSAGNAYRVNEDGRSEIFQTAGGQQMFIPNQSGKVISADKAGGGGVQNVYFTINTTGGISDAEWAQIEAKAINISKKMALFQISDQANRPNGMIQPRRK